MSNVNSVTESFGQLNLAAKDPKPGYVYMVHETRNEGNPQNYKIGQSGKPEDRLSTLQTGNPRKLVEVPGCTIEVNDMSKAEKDAKIALKSYKCTLGGGIEWFTATEEEYDAFIKAFKDAVDKYKPAEK